MDDSAPGMKNATYELFIGALSVLSIFNLVLIYLARDPYMAETAAAMDFFLSIIFLCDFLYRLFSADSKSRYFLKQYGWADLLASLPFPQAKVLRVFRIIRVGRIMRQFGARRMMREFVKNRASSAMLSVLLFIILLLEFGGMLILRAETGSPDANITSASDAVWWAYVTMTTVGYGDQFPVTRTGRLVGMVVMAAGVGLFGVLTGFLANAFLAPDEVKPDVAEAVLEGEPLGVEEQIMDLRRLLAEQGRLHGALVSRLEAIESAVKDDESDPSGPAQPTGTETS